MSDETAQHILDDELHRLVRKYGIINLLCSMQIFQHHEGSSEPMLFFE